MRKSTEKVRAAAEQAKPYVDQARPYVERALTDEQFRESLRAAFLAAKDIYDEVVPQRGVSGLASKVSDDDVQQSLRRAVAELRHAADRLHEEERQSHNLRNAMLIMFGVVIGIFFNPFTGPGTRRWVKGHVSGGEFSYNGHDTTETVTAPEL
jgi:hypothetical protein